MDIKEYIEGLERLLAEAYQVVGHLLDITGQFETEHGQKILDNLAEMRVVHEDVLPWPGRGLRITRVKDTGEVVAVTWQDEEHQILRTVWSKE